MRISAFLLSTTLALTACDSGITVDTDRLAEELPGALVGPSFDTGNAQIDAFLVAVESGDRATVVRELAGVESMSGRPLPFTDASGYMDRIQTCDVAEVRDGLMGAGGATDVSVEVVWNCANGQFRQIIDTEFKAPKIVVTELF